MRRVLALLVVLGLTAALQAGASSGSIDEFINAEMPASGAPGLAYAVVEDGEITSGARGEALRGSGDPVTPHTPSLIGSISKSFTAMAVMQLVEAGQVDLDAPVSRYMEVFADRPSGAITIRQLLGHTSGYSTRQGNGAHTDQRGAEDAFSRHVAQIAQWTPAHQPGMVWDYSNANYQILGAVIEAVSGEDYAGYVERRILAPIGMENSFVADGERHDGVARGHLPWFGTKRPVKDSRPNRITAPAGGVIASADDLARYLAVMMNGQDDVISAGSKADMLRPASSALPNYGFGWSLDAESGTVFHTGTSRGVETLALFVPAESKGAVVLVNAGSGFGFGETATLRTGLSATALGLDHDGDAGGWSRKSVFLMFALLPPFFVFCAVWAWLHRDRLRAKAGFSGLVSIWLPLPMMVALAWTALYLIPALFGISIGTLYLFLPDMALMMMATAATGLLWAVFRLGVFYSGRS